MYHNAPKHEFKLTQNSEADGTSQNPRTIFLHGLFTQCFDWQHSVKQELKNSGRKMFLSAAICDYFPPNVLMPLHQRPAGIPQKYWYQTIDQSPNREHGNGRNHRDDRPHPCAFDPMSSQHWRGLRRGLAYNRT